MMAASVRYIVQMGGIMDTILHWASSLTTGLNPFTAAMAIYGLTLVMELFITSGSAKALLLIPILMPLADLVHVTRQIAVSAYCFGDGFSNLVYPTNAALLITLSLTVVPYYKWVRWLLKLWLWIFLATVARSMPQFGMLLVLVLLPLELLSGGMTPRESMPRLVQDLMQAAPTTHFVTVAQAILYRGAGIDVVWPALLAIAVIGSVLFSAALARFRNTSSQMAGTPEALMPSETLSQPGHAAHRYPLSLSPRR